MQNRFAAALLLAAIAAPASAQTGIDAANLTQTVRTLASDQFQGRAPGTVGEERTVGYLIGRLEAMGLEPAGVDGGWTQPVPLLHTRLGTPEPLALARKGAATPLRFATDLCIPTPRPNDRPCPPRAPRTTLSHALPPPQ